MVVVGSFGGGYPLAKIERRLYAEIMGFRRARMVSIGYHTYRKLLYVWYLMDTILALRNPIISTYNLLSIFSNGYPPPKEPTTTNCNHNPLSYICPTANQLLISTIFDYSLMTIKCIIHYLTPPMPPTLP